MDQAWILFSSLGLNIRSWNVGAALLSGFAQNPPFLGLSDKTGGKKFSKEFEEASAKLEEFVNSLDKQVKDGPSLTEVLENAGIFYEAQYKEVKVVANVSLQGHTDAPTPTPTTSPGPSPGAVQPSWGEAHRDSCSSVRLATKAQLNGQSSAAAGLWATAGGLWRGPRDPPSLPPFRLPAQMASSPVWH